MTSLPDFTTQGYQTLELLRVNSHSGRATYKAIQLNNRQLVVIKQIKFISGSMWSEYDCLEKESDILRKINHPYIPRYLSTFQTEDSYCLVQEYKKAKPLSEIGKLNLSEIKDLTISLLKILVYLQEQKPLIIHRDIKPENILYSSDKKVYLIDFGFASLGNNKLGISSTVKGTMGFMPPEQLFNRSLTEASDLYSLGITIICLLTQTSSLDVGNLIDNNFQVEFDHLIPKLNSSFKDWLYKMVESDANQRFANAQIALENFIKIDQNKKENSNNSVNLFEAFKILGLRKNVSFEQVKQKYRQLVKIYHPDVPKTGDAQKFILISAAFTIIEEHYLGNKNETKLADEVIFASKVKENIEKSFKEIKNSYDQKKQKLLKKVPEDIRRKINSASSSSKLEQIVKEDIKEYLVKTFKEIEFYLNTLINKAKSEDQQFLNNLFKDLYLARRNYWLSTLYKNPIVIFTLTGIMIQILIKFFVNLPLFNSMLLIFSPSIMLLSLIIYIIIKLIILNPGYQFIPPSFSLASLSKSLEKISKNLDQDRQEKAMTGSLVGLGALLGLSAFIPIAGPVMGISAGIVAAVSGGIWGFLSGKSLQKIKDETFENIIQQFYDAIEQIDERMELWLSSSQEEIIRVTEESFAQNLHSIKNLILKKQLPPNMTKQQLLLPGKKGKDS